MCSSDLVDEVERLIVRRVAVEVEQRKNVGRGCRHGPIIVATADRGNCTNGVMHAVHRRRRKKESPAERAGPPFSWASPLALAALLAGILLARVLRLLAGLLLPAALLLTRLAVLATLRLLTGLLVRILVLLGHRQTPRFPAPSRTTRRWRRTFRGNPGFVAISLAGGTSAETGRGAQTFL